MTAAGKKALANVLYPVALIALVLAVWAIAAAAVGSQFILPGIADTFVALGDLLANGEFYVALGGTLARAIIGYVLAVALFFLLFFLSTAFEGAERVITPLVAAMRTLPTMAIALVFAIWAGANATPVILGVAVIAPQLYSSAVAHNSTVPKELEEVCRLCGAPRGKAFTSLYLPHAAAAFPESLSAAFSFNIKIVIAAEILMQTAHSIGMLMALSQAYLETAALIAMTVAAVVVSILSETALRAALGRALIRFAD